MGAFTKAQSGNPGGRPKAVVLVIEAARQCSVEAVETLAEIMRERDTPPSARIAACNAILDRGFGRVLPVVTLEGEQPDPVTDVVRQIVLVSPERL